MNRLFLALVCSHHQHASAALLRNGPQNGGLGLYLCGWAVWLQTLPLLFQHFGREALYNQLSQANFTLRGMIEKSTYKSQITLASLDSLYQYTEKDIFGSPSSRKNDGIHLRGRHGATAYTECIITALKSAGLCLTRSTDTEGVNSSSIPTSNYYEVLSN